MTSKMVFLAGMMALTMGLSGCDKKATGQVVAVVNGEEISTQELNAELQGARIPENTDKKQLMREVLQRVIDRKLMVQRAKEQGLDKDPEYLAQQRRLEENLLVSLVGKQVANTVKIPDAAEIDKFIAENPAMFAQRTRYTLDQIQFDLPADPSRLKVLEADHTLDAVGARLTALGIKYQRGQAGLDSATIPAPLMKQITSLPPGEPFVLPMNGKVFASVITGQQVVPTAPDVARPAATEAIRRRDLNDLAAKQIKQARDVAKIEYQPGYEPVKPVASPAAAPAKPAG